MKRAVKDVKRGGIGGEARRANQDQKVIIELEALIKQNS